MGRDLHVTVDQARLREPFRIAGYVFEGLPAVRVTLSEDGFEGRGEAGGVYFLGDDPAHMLSEIDRVRPIILDGIGRQELREALPPGGARNALDAALWELEARRSGQPVWRLAGIQRTRRLTTTYTLSADAPADLLRKLGGFADARALKLKLDGVLDADIERLRLVHRERPDVWLMVDANQGYAPDRLDTLASVLVECRVRLIEQPVARGAESGLDGLKLPIPIAADESVLCLDDLAGLVGRFQTINIKLDKCGGLTEALMMVEAAHRLGLRAMVGNMGGTSLAAAPAFLLGQLCDVVDLDGPKLLAEDLPGGARYEDGMIDLDTRFWGPADAASSSNGR